MCTIDLKESYFLIPVGVDKKYLRFWFQNVMYEFTCMPFGLSTAPFTFTKLLKPVINYLRGKGYKSVCYLDDINCIGKTYQECLENCQVTIRLLECLGFIINREKSNIVPSNTAVFLGFVVNTKDMSLSVTPKKKENIAILIKKYLGMQQCTIREFAKLIGTLVACSPAVSYGFLYTKTLEQQKYHALCRENNNFDAVMSITDKCKADLKWWDSNIKISNNVIKQFKFDLEVYSDSSKTGWGVYCNGAVANGFWTPEDQENHINYLELLAAFLGLQCFAKDLHSCQILLRIDNTTAIAYINKMGGIQFDKLNSLARTIWQWSEVRRIWLFASYIKSKENKEADRESRIKNIDSEWELCDTVFLNITKSLGEPDIDLFATRANKKCQRYLSWHRDPYAENIDAFTVDWSTFNLFYAFPPFSLISKCIQKIICDKATGIMVFPLWPSQPWYPYINELAITKVLQFQPSKNLLLSPFRTLHPLHNSLSLGACILSGKHSRGN